MFAESYLRVQVGSGRCGSGPINGGFGPQPRPNFIGFFSAATFDDRHG